MQILFSRQLSPTNGCLSLLWIPLTVCLWRVHLQPIGETCLLQWPMPQPQLTTSKNQILTNLHLKQYNNFLNPLEILSSSGKWMTDLPSLPQYCQPSQPFLCWNSILGECFRGARCRYSKGHLKKGEAMDAFAKAVSECISKGVGFYTNLPAGASPPRYKCGGATPEP